MKIQDRFEIYHNENPHVYDLFIRFARETRNKGFNSYSANAIFERLRWHLNIETVGDAFKINNNYRAYYARKMMDDFPAYKGFFQTRELRSI